MKNILIAMICGGAFGFPAVAETRPDYSAPLLAGHVLTGGTYSIGGGITVAADMRPHEGRTLICGVWALSRFQPVLTKHKERRVLAGGSVFVDGERVIHGLLFMAQVDRAADYTGATAGCVLTDRAWRAGASFEDLTIRIPRRVVANETDGDVAPSGGPLITFRQTGPGAGTE